jgi:uncharacterized protein (TIGR03437 family)
MRTPLLLLLFAATLAAQPRVTGVGNAADYAPAVAPGSLATVVGTGLAPATGSAASLPLPTTLNGVSVTLGGRPARLSYISPTQINFQVPAATPAGPANLAVTVNGAASNSSLITVTAAAPGVFQYGANRGVVQNQDFSLNTAANPVAAGASIIVYLTGIGATNPAVADGVAAPSGPLATPLAARHRHHRRRQRALSSSSASPPAASASPKPTSRSPPYPPVTTPSSSRMNNRSSQPVQIAVRGNTPAPPPGGGGGNNQQPLPSDLTCLSGPVTEIIFSLAPVPAGLADEVTIGDTRLCATCPVKPPLYVQFVQRLNAARRAGRAVDACYDSAGTFTYLRLNQ